MSQPPTVELYKGDLPQGRFSGRAIAIDTETLGLNPYRDRLCLVQLSEGDGSAALVQFAGTYDAPELKRLLADESVLKIFHFGRFDMAVLKHYFRGDAAAGLLHQGRLAPRPHLHRPPQPQGPVQGAARHRAFQAAAILRLGGGELTLDQLNYAASDVLHLHALREKLDAMLRREGRESLARACFEFLPVRAELDLRGWSEIDPFAH